MKKEHPELQVTRTFKIDLEKNKIKAYIEDDGTSLVLQIPGFLVTSSWAQGLRELIEDAGFDGEELDRMGDEIIDLIDKRQVVNYLAHVLRNSHSV